MPGSITVRVLLSIQKKVYYFYFPRQHLSIRTYNNFVLVVSLNLITSINTGINVKNPLVADFCQM